MNQSELISVIVPVYKTEAYLDRCVQSIVDQTYRSLEIILVDDGSPDNCPAMCDVWAEKDSRIKVIHKENGGLSDARNTGMSIATGSLIGFVDSDDYISSNMYQLLYERMKADDSDISACGVVMIFEDSTIPKMLTKEGSCLLDTREALSALIDETTLKQPVWYKLYKTDMIHDLYFPVGKYHEDVFWSYQAITKANKVSVMDTPCYFYIQHQGSIMNANYSLRRLDALEAKCQRIDFLAKRFPELLSKARTDLLFTCLYMGQMSLLHMDEDERKQAFEKLYTARREYPLTDDDKRSLPLKQRIWAILSDASFITACKLRNCLKIGI